jgi:L-alanine-DL-glutamate epimerase-like enolase superfamily enzyme
MPRIEKVEASAFEIPTEKPESDGTMEWQKTTLVVAEVTAGGKRGLGYTYANAATARFIKDELAGVVTGLEAFDIPCAWEAMRHAIRNLGAQSMVAMGRSAVDAALWDLKGKLLDVAVARLLGCARERVPVYGSGGFTSYTTEKLVEQLGGWAQEGMRRVKMKVGRVPVLDTARVQLVREAIGPEVELFVDANGAYSRKQALSMADTFAAFEVTWFEEPVSADDLEGLRFLREQAPMDIAAGEYGYDLPYFLRLIPAVDILQADATRCCGITGFMQVAAVCEAAQISLSAHCAPALHVHAACAAPRFAHIEWFFDHARIERMLFDGARSPERGRLAPDFSRPGLGIELKRQDAEDYRTC